MRRWVMHAMVCVVAARVAIAAPQPAYKVVKRVSLETRDTPPTFVCLDGPMLLDRGRMVQLGRSIEKPNLLRVLDLRTLVERDLVVPEVSTRQVRGASETGVDKPVFYDSDNGMAGVFLRTGIGVRSDVSFAAWDLRTNRITTQLPLAAVGEAQWLSADAVGYDPDRRECFVQIVTYGARFKTSPNSSDQYDVTVLGITDRVRTVAAWRTSNKLVSQPPHFDPIHRRSMHITYAEHAGMISNAYMVNLDSGDVKTFELPPLIYGFAFDPDGKNAYVYSYRTREVFPLNLETGVAGKGRVYGNVGHLLEFVAPGVLCLGRDFGMHFLDTQTLKERWFLNPKDFNKVDAHLEGSIFLPGRALVRSYENFYVIDFPSLGIKPISKRKP